MNIKFMLEIAIKRFLVSAHSCFYSPFNKEEYGIVHVALGQFHLAPSGPHQEECQDVALSAPPIPNRPYHFLQ